MKFGKELSIDEIKTLLIEELKYIDYICQKYNINYFLIGGSLLGAVRHKGFIPWDDDIDIGMLRKDYNKFVKILKKCKGRYQLVDIDTMKGYYLPFAKLIDNHTILIEDVKDSVELGIAIDIFPFDNCPVGDYEKACKFSKKLNIYRNLLSLKCISKDKKRGFLKNFLILSIQFIFSWISREALIKKINLIASKYLNEDNSEYVAELCYMPYGNREIYKKIWIEKTIRMKFEQYDFKVPVYYHEFLKNTFGDYMKLPPLDKQISHHDFKCWWKN